MPSNNVIQVRHIVEALVQHTTSEAVAK